MRQRHDLPEHGDYKHNAHTHHAPRNPWFSKDILNKLGAFYFTIRKRSVDEQKVNVDDLHVLDLIDKEQLLKFSHSNWIEPYMLELFKKIIIYAKNLAEICIKRRQWEEVEYIGNKLLLWNNLHDDGMRYLVLAKKMLKKNALSHQVYSDFIKNYELEIGEVYPFSYDKVISRYKTE